MPSNLEASAGPRPGRDRPRRWPRGVLHGAAAVLGGGVAVLALALVPPEVETVGPATFSGRVSLGSGGTDLRVPPLGEVKANTHRIPLSFRLALEEVDVQALGDAISTGTGAAEFTTQMESGLRDLAVTVSLKALLAAVVAGAIAAALLPRRRWPYVVFGAWGGGLVVAALLAATAVTYEVDAFEQPRFTGALTRAPVMIEALNENELTLAQVQSRFENAATRLTDLLGVLASPDLDPRTDTLAVLHISDVHSNPIGLEIARQLAEQFDVDAIVDTGDLTNFGLELETRFARLVDDMPAPYYYVSGNHDSVSIQAELQGLPNVTVVHGRSVDIGGVTFFGWPDPTYSNWNLLDPSEAAEIRVAEGARVADEVERAAPDVLMVHDKRTATGTFGLVPLIVAGHNHRRIVEEERGTRLLSVGSTGAAGLQTFTTDADVPYEAEIIYFRGTQAVATDYVRFTGLEGSFDIKRTLLEPLGRLEPPEATPSPTPEPSPAGT